MYTEFYKLVERPFELTPDPRYVYFSAHHREALAHLKYGVEERKGFIQLTGEVGTGKTTMLDVLVSELDASTVVAKLSYTTIDELDLLRILARGFGITGDANTKADVLGLLTERLALWSKEGRNAVFAVDEAQNLSLPVLEEIRLLSNLRSNGKLSLQIILAGQPELRGKLETTELRQLRQRIGIRYHLTPLSRQETGEYIAHRIAVAGSDERIFDAGAIDVVYEHSQGVPRIVNMVCDRALLAGYAENKRRVTGDLVRRAIAGLEGAAAPSVDVGAQEQEPVQGEATPRAERTRRRSRVRWAAPLAAALAVVAISVGAVFYFEGRERAAVSTSPRSESALASVSESESEEPLASVSEPESDAVLASVSESESDELLADPLGEETAVETGAAGRAEAADGTGGIAVADEAAESGTAWMTAAAEPAPSSEAPARQAYTVVVASSRDIDAARNQVEALANDGIAASVWTVDLGDRGMWHRIVLEAAFDSLSTASTAAAYVKEMGYPDAWVARK